MSLFALLGGIESGLIYAFVAVGVFLSFRVLDFPDLTVDGSFPLGAAVTASLIVFGHWNPWAATLAGMLAGSIAGFLTAYFSVKWGILHLLSSILTMTALYSVNIRIMDGKANLTLLNQDTVLTPFYGIGLNDEVVRPLFLAVIVVIVFAALVWFLLSEQGLAMRATGANRRMSRAQGVGTDRQVIAGMMLSNALVGLAGSLFAQTNGFADVTMGTGTIVIGLAAVIVGETLIPSRHIWLKLLACIIGAVIYRLVIQFALSIDFLGLQASDLNLVTATLVLLALILPKLKQKVFA